ncbi:hypothetical protein BDZ45DRAFT_282417 [Acephala macrosclerotiorum]|nr:hypothetical protein BDZ45DRAFT_282417 [Acephala macrosclerotiorum]
MSTTIEHRCQACWSSSEKNCASCRATWYCSADCQKSDWPLHKTRCKFLQNHPLNSEPQPISCVKIHSPHTRYESVTILSDHSIFTTKALPITTKFGYPLVISRETENLPRGTNTDNHHATWLNIDPESGFAPADWQGGIGTVIAAAADGSPLSTGVLGAITDYVSNILDRFGDGGVPRDMYKRAKLDTFIEQQLKMQADYQS